MAWDRIKRWFSKGSEDADGERQNGEGDASLPDLPWLAPADNPWGVPLLDVRPVTLHFMSASRDPRPPPTSPS